MSSDLKIAFYKSNMNLKSRLKIIALKVPQSMKMIRDWQAKAWQALTLPRYLPRLVVAPAKQVPC